MIQFLALILSALVPFAASASKLDEHAGKLAALIELAKLATLKSRGANPRIRKAVAFLAEHRARSGAGAALRPSVGQTPGW